MTVDLSDVFRDHWPKLKLTPHQNKVVIDIITCRTPELGSHVIECSNKDCDNADLLFNSCMNSHCPKCQTLYQLKWAAVKMKEILPVKYMNIVITVPSCLREIFQYNAKRGFAALSYAVNRGLHSTFAKGNNQLGVLAVIHTATQLLNYSPHIHCLAPKGYLNSDKTRWIQIKKNIKMYQEKLSVQVKINLLKELKRMDCELRLHLPEDKIADGIEPILQKARMKKIKIYLEDNVSDIEHAIKYLADKNKKVIINNQKIVDYKDNMVTISYSDRKNKNEIKEKEIDALIFLKRFVLHILPSRFIRIRYYGFLSNSCKKSSLELCKKLIKKANIIYKKIKSRSRKIVLDLIEKYTNPSICPVCKQGVMLLDGL